jgi:hypothetical protein
MWSLVWLSLWTSVGVAGEPGPSFNTDPDCGQPGSTLVWAEGTGWPIPRKQGPCLGAEYRYFFRARLASGAWQSISLGVQDLFATYEGQPAHEFTVPAGVPEGEHIVRCEQWVRFSSGWKGPADGYPCLEVAFCALDNVHKRDPWSKPLGGFTLMTSQGLTLLANPIYSQEKDCIEWAFDPTNACSDVPPCKAITYLQVGKMEGFDTNLSPPDWRVLTAVEQGLRHATEIDAVTTPAGWFIDDRVPYPFVDQKGKQECGGVEPAKMHDCPARRSDALVWNYPPGVTNIRIKYETVAYCWSGTGVGKPLGHATWSWNREAAQEDPQKAWGTFHPGPELPSLGEPSTEFTDALNAFVSRKVKKDATLPKQGEHAVEGGHPCQ